jgi:hypothetical protein
VRDDDQVPVIGQGEPPGLAFAATVGAQLVQHVWPVAGPVARHPAMLTRPPPRTQTMGRTPRGMDSIGDTVGELRQGGVMIVCVSPSRSG